MLAAADFTPSLIILDLNMPRISGFTFLQRYEPRDIPIVVFSVSPVSTDKEFTLELGASDYVQKPIDLEAFADAVCGCGPQKIHPIAKQPLVPADNRDAVRQALASI